MTPEQFIDESAGEIEDYISSIEYDMDALATEYLTTFKYENGNLVNGASNYEKSNSSGKVFDDAFDTFIAVFLLFLGNKILKGSEVVISDMESRGIEPCHFQARTSCAPRPRSSPQQRWP